MFLICPQPQTSVYALRGISRCTCVIVSTEQHCIRSFCSTRAVNVALCHQCFRAGLGSLQALSRVQWPHCIITVHIISARMYKAIAPRCTPALNFTRSIAAKPRSISRSSSAIMTAGKIPRHKPALPCGLLPQTRIC
jgi:hypothetical protein